MGFLSGAYGKLMAGKLVRQLQHQQTSIQLRLNRVTKQAGEMEKYFNRMERNMKAQMQSQMQYASMGIANGFPMLQQFGVPTGANASQFLNAQNSEYQNYMQCQQMMQQQFAMAQNVWQDQFEMMRESQLQPLHDLEDSLQTELDNVKSRLQLAKDQYDAKKKEEQDGAKNMVPDYTGQG